MNLWIRNQGGEQIVNCKNIGIFTFDDDKYNIFDLDRNIKLGHYTNCRQAFDVLDEIMEKMFVSDYITIAKTPNLDNTYTGNFNIDVVYQMPEDKGVDYENLH